MGLVLVQTAADYAMRDAYRQLPHDGTWVQTPREITTCMAVENGPKAEVLNYSHDPVIRVTPSARNQAHKIVTYWFNKKTQSFNADRIAKRLEHLHNYDVQHERKCAERRVVTRTWRGQVLEAYPGWDVRMCGFHAAGAFCIEIASRDLGHGGPCSQGNGILIQAFAPSFDEAFDRLKAHLVQPGNVMEHRGTSHGHSQADYPPVSMGKDNVPDHSNDSFDGDRPACEGDEECPSEAAMRRANSGLGGEVAHYLRLVMNAMGQKDWNTAWHNLKAKLEEDGFQESEIARIAIGDEPSEAETVIREAVIRMLGEEPTPYVAGETNCPECTVGSMVRKNEGFAGEGVFECDTCGHVETGDGDAAAR